MCSGSIRFYHAYSSETQRVKRQTTAFTKSGAGKAHCSSALEAVGPATVPCVRSGLAGKILEGRQKAGAFDYATEQAEGKINER